MALTYEKVKHIILDEMRARGYSPNPADAHHAATKIMELSKEPAEVVADEAPEDSRKPSKK